MDIYLSPFFASHRLSVHNYHWKKNTETIKPMLSSPTDNPYSRARKKLPSHCPKQVHFSFWARNFSFSIAQWVRNLASHRPTQSLKKQTMTCSKQANFERYLLQGQAGNQVFLALRQPELPIIIEKGPLYTFLVVLTLSEHIIRNTPPLWLCGHVFGQCQVSLGSTKAIL